MNVVRGEDFDPCGATKIHQLGDGGFGSVDLYWQRNTGFFALKRFKGARFCETRETKPDPKLRERFHREVAIMQGLSHVAVPHVFSCGMPPRVENPSFDPWIAMEFFPGGTLSDFITDRLCGGSWPPLSLTESLIVLYGITDVLRELHARGSVHRDVKSLNIFMDTDDEPYLGDFGLARPIVAGMTPGAGTPIYAAPELLSSENYDQRVDIWGLGMVAYEIRTGLCPFLENGQQSQPTRVQVFQMVTSGTNMPVLEDDWFTQFFEMCVRTDPDERGTIDDCLHWLNTAAEVIPDVDRAKFEAYKAKLELGRQPSVLRTIADVEELAGPRSSKAKFLLAKLLDQGVVVPRDPERAAELFRELASVGNAQAAEALLNMFERGAVTTEGPDEAERLRGVKNRGREVVQQVGTGLQFRLRTLIELASSERGPWESKG